MSIYNKMKKSELIAECQKTLNMSESDCNDYTVVELRALLRNGTSIRRKDLDMISWVERRTAYDYSVCLVCRNGTLNDRIDMCFGCCDKMGVKFDKIQEKIILRNSEKDNLISANKECLPCMQKRCVTVSALLCNYHTEVVAALADKAYAAQKSKKSKKSKK